LPFPSQPLIANPPESVGTSGKIVANDTVC
jgi:hypothetical protein